MQDVKTDKLHVWNTERARQRFRPASTFKIANAIIGLESRVVESIDEVIPYGGTKEFNPAWEQDMNLREAVKVSNVAVFHQLAKREGLPTIKKYVAEFGYGNGQAGDDIERRFWLEGPLEISAFEQVAFLRKLATAQLPIRQQTRDWIREILLFKATDDYRIYAKTGWVGPKDPQIGWWVGWVQKGESVYPFSLNINIQDSRDAAQRVPIGLDCLASLGIITAQEVAPPNAGSRRD
jgi:beta-lactamase class D